MVTADPAALDEVAAQTGIPVEPALATKASILKAIENVYGSPQDKKTSKGHGRIGLDAKEKPTLDLHEVLEIVMERGASDLHLTVGLPPVLRVDGDLMHLDGYAALEADDVQRVVYAMLSQKQRERFEEDLELDLSYSLPGKARFRVN